jgi:very-short-patch-repair endonuclease
VLLISQLAPILLLLIAVSAVVVGAALYRKRPPDGPWPFTVRKPLSAPEQVMFFRLRDALPEQIILAQVQVSRFLDVRKGFPARRWFNRVNRLSVDFLVLAKDATVIAAIEIDDATHERADRREADARKDRALASAGVRLVRWHVRTLPDAAQIRADVLSRPPSAR